MLKNKTKYILLITLVYVVSLKDLRAKDLKSSIGILSHHSEIGKGGKPTGKFVELVEAINDTYTEGEISFQLFPYARSLHNVTTGQADFHLPLIKGPYVQEGILPFSYVTEPITQVSFVLFTRANESPIEQNQLSHYHIETVRGIRQFFPFKVTETNTIEQGIMKLIMGRTDGFIMEQDAVDKYIRKHKIKNIRRTLYAVWDSCIIISKGPRQKKMDVILSTALRKLKKTGRLQEITKNIHQPYLEWQPYQMKW